MKLKKRIVFFVFWLGISFNLFGCGGISNLKNEKEIIKDIIEYYEEMGQEVHLDYQSLTIDKRQTNKDKKEDVIYATVVAETGSAKHTYKYEIYYIYYDKGGWILENCPCNLTDITITSPPDEKLFLNQFTNPNAMILAYGCDNITGTVKKSGFLEDYYSETEGYKDIEDPEESEDLITPANYHEYENTRYYMEIEFTAENTSGLIGYKVEGIYNQWFYYDKEIGDWCWDDENTYLTFTSQEITGLEGKWQSQSSEKDYFTFLNTSAHNFEGYHAYEERALGEPLTLVYMAVLMNQIDLITDYGDPFRLFINWEDGYLTIYDDDGIEVTYTKYEY